MQNLIERARRYLGRLPPSISGSGGHLAAFNAAQVAAVGFDLDDETALHLLMEWNAGNAPPWSESDLRRKIASARRDGKRIASYLLSDSTRKTEESPTARTPTTSAQKRDRWPAFLPLSEAAQRQVAKLRHLPLTAIIGVHRRGFLKGAMVDGQPCFIMTEGTFAQARRLDGQPFTRADGTKIKAKNLPGSEGAFIGKKWIGGPTMRVLIIEGVIGMIEALAGHDAADPVGGWTIIAATSAGSRFSRDPELLAALGGRFVRILADPNEAGLVGAASWLSDLEGEGCAVEVLTPPDDPGDWGEVFSKQHEHKQILQAVFQ